MWRRYASQDYNWLFNTKTGTHVRWGATTDSEDDPDYSPVGPEILDMEISTICHGIDNKPCQFCYKANTGVGENMSFETFKTIFDKMPMNLTQIAFGIGDIDSNPDMWKMFEYCRTNSKHLVIPNITINGWNLTDERAQELVKLCGAVAVSRYAPKDVCYDAVDKLASCGMMQVNIHQVLSEETMNACYEVVDDIAEDPRLSKLKAVVFLLYKPKGRGITNGYTSMNDVTRYAQLMNYAFERNVDVGMDSCSAPLTLKARDLLDKTKIDTDSVEPCESLLFSSYINVRGILYPCSFLEGEPGYEEGIDVVAADNFLDDIWNHPKVKKWRKQLLSSTSGCKGHCNYQSLCRACPMFDITPCKKEAVRV